MTRIARAGALLALALLTALAVAGPAAADGRRHAKPKHAKQSKSPFKQWQRDHRSRGGAKGDPDDDGLSNWGEFRSHTRPNRGDSDRDGTGDAAEDFDRDGLDNGSEEASGTDPGRNDTDRDGIRDGAEDADSDGLSNAAEDATGNDPRDPDTDGDGVEDGAENAGVVQAFDGTTLTIALARGGTLTAKVDEDTDVSCDAEAAYEEESGGSDPDDPDDSGEGDDEDATGTLSVTAFLAEEGDEDAVDDEEWDADESDDCTAELTPGTAVHEAAVEAGVFWSVELVL